MINVLTALAAPPRPHAVPDDQRPDDEQGFAALLGLPGNAEPAEREDVSGEALAGVLAQAEEALKAPDLNDDEIAEILGPVIARLGAELTGDPALRGRIEALVADIPAPQAEAQISGETAAPTPWRLLAEGLAELTQSLAGTPPDEDGGVGLGALLHHALGAAADLAPAKAPRSAAPAATALDTQLADAPRGSGGSQGVAPEVAQDEPAGARDPRLREAASNAGAASVDDTPHTESATARPVETPPADLAALSRGLREASAPAGQVAAPMPAMPLAPVAAMPAPASALAAAQLAAGAPQLAAPQGQEVLGQIRANLHDDGQIKVELKPEGLGKVEIALGPDEAGKMQVVVRADQAAVLSALRAERDGLVAMLRDAGHAVDDSALNFADLGADTGGQGGAPGGNGSGYTTYGPARDAADGPAGAAQTQTIHLPAGSVDIRI